LGSSSFISTLNELKPFLKFNCLSDEINNKYDLILFHDDVLKNNKKKEFINNSNSIKILASKKKNLLNNFDAYLELPAILQEINISIENISAKKKFNKNSSIQVKNYLLDKNQKKLFTTNDFIILTEKEVQLIELFLNNKKPISKNDILESVWNYSAEADTHTVETHIYRLRKKISKIFLDDKFILNNKDGYYL